MRCPKCNNEINESAEFCLKCGALVNAGAVEKPLFADRKLAMKELGRDSEADTNAAEPAEDELPVFEPVDIAIDDKFQERGWDKWNHAKLELYEKKDVREASELKKFSLALSVWIKQIDSTDYKKIASKIKVLSMDEYPLYQAIFSTVFEKRDNIEAFVSEYKNERLYRKTAKSPENVDLWGYRTTNDITYLGSRNTYVMPDTMYTEKCKSCTGKRISCTYCQGSGKISCNECHGSGKIRCIVCRGSMKVTCQECKGSGILGENKCFECGGVGLTVCKKCKDGYTDCEKCRKKGKVDCSYCEGGGYKLCGECRGSGRILKGFRFMSTFKVWSESKFVENFAISKGIVPLSENLFTADTTLVEIAVKKLSSYDFLGAVECKGLREKINSIVQKGFRQLGDYSKIRRQKLIIRKYPVWAMRYVYDGKSYVMYFLSKKLKIFFVDSPFIKLAEEAFSRAKKQLFMLNFYGAAKSCLQASTIREYEERAKIFMGKLKKSLFLFYDFIGVLGGITAGWVYVSYFLAKAENTFNESLPGIILLVLSVFLGYASAFLSRQIIKLRLNKYKRKLIIPALLSMVSVFGIYFGIFQGAGFDPYKMLDQIQFEREFKEKFPYGVAAVYDKSDSDSLKNIAKKYKNMGIDLSIVRNGIDLQEKLRRENIKMSKKKIRKKSKKTVGRRTNKVDQKLDFLWIKKKKR